MNLGRLLVAATLAATACLLTACGGGSKAVVTTPQTLPVSAPSLLDRFLLFPNPQQQPDKSFQTKEEVYAQAYYKAIDANHQRETLAQWKALNQFDSGTGQQVTVAFGDKRDLGYGRRMTGRQNTDGTIAFLVESYQVDPGGVYGFSPLSVEAAAREDKRWRILINAIEFSPAKPGGVSFAKFFNFNTVTENRELNVDLDGRGPKAMPGPCITCHGGRGDALVPVNGELLFNIAQNSASNANGNENVRGDVQAHLAPLEVDTFEFVSVPGFTRAEQEDRLKTMNMFVLCTYPRPNSAPVGVPPNFCVRDRRLTVPGEWQGTAAEMIITAYGGDGLASHMYADTKVPPGWGGQSGVFLDVVAPSCRACHILRGTAGPDAPQSDIDFTTLAKFESFAKSTSTQEPNDRLTDDRIKIHVFDRGDMPLAKFVSDTFLNSANLATLATFLEGRGFTVHDAGGAVLRPGRPIADPGPDRVITQEATVLSAEGSLFATTFAWTILPNPAIPPPTLDNRDSAHPTFKANAPGNYVLELVASNGAAQSAPARLTLVVPPALSPSPAAIRFAHIKAEFVTAGCTGCHSPGGFTPGPAVFFADSGGNIRSDEAFYAEVRSRINFTDIVASPLLRKPSGKHHGGGTDPQPRFDARLLPGATNRVGYDLFLNWSLNGAPQ